MTNTENQVAANTENQVAVTDNSRVTDTYEIVKGANGKYSRKAIYKAFSSITPVTKEEKIAMMNLLDGDGIAQPFDQHIGKQIQIADVVLRPYDAVNEDTGEMEYGALTYIITPEGTAFVTSSKSVYYTLQNIFTAFGQPHYEGENILTVQIVKKKGQKHEYTDIKIVG